MVSLGSFFQRQQAPLLGLDISTSSVKLVELGRRRSGEWTLEHYALEPLARDCFVDGNLDKFDDVAQAIRRAVKKSASKAHNVAMALPASAVITKKILLPEGLSELELEQQVETEASQYIPFSLDEVNLDFCTLGSSQKSAGDIEVLIAAARREKVQDIQGLAEAAGLTPMVVDVESYAARLATARAVQKLPQQGKGQIVVLFEVGALTTSMQVLRDEDVLYERDQAFGGFELTQRIVHQYGFSLEEAEIKKRSGDLPQDYANTVLRPFLETLAYELGRFLQFFFTSTPHNRVDHIFVAGGCATLPKVAKVVGGQTGFSCTVLDPFEGMSLSPALNAKKVHRTAPSYLTACGLAMRRFTL